MSAREKRPRSQGRSAERVVGQQSVWYRARGWIAGGVIGVLVVTVAVVSSGFDAQEVLRKEPNVWVARDAGQYARVNTETGEIDTVRKVTEPSGVLQVGSESVVLTNANGKAWPIDAALPVDFSDSSSGGSTDSGSEERDDTVASGSQEIEAVRMPEGTREVIVSGNYVLVRTEPGAVYVGTVAEAVGYASGASADELASRLQSLRQIDPLAEQLAKEQAERGAVGEAGAAEEAEQLGTRIDAIAISDDGTAALYSAADGTIWRYDVQREAFVGGATELPAEAKGLESAQLALVAGEWVLFDSEAEMLWRQGADPASLSLTGSPRLQASGVGVGDAGGGGNDAVIADVSGLWRVSKQGDAALIASAEGTPAQPRPVGTTLYAAWIGQADGTLWSSDTRETQSLSFDESATELGEVAPIFFTNGERAVLGETRTGMLWTLPSGRLIPLSQWTISDPPKEDQGTVVVDDVTEQVPPTAVNDAFGVRAGEPAPLPLLLNDFDANKRDVLTIVPESLGESALSEDFGTVGLAADAQSLMVHPNPGATGTATFTYRISDGAQTSDAATVTLTVASDDTNSAPAWCPVEGCQRSWAVPAIAPGGTLVYPILEGWVDPEGDAMMLAEVELLRPEDPANAIVTADGRLAVRHTDANAGASEILLRLTVRDGRGDEQHRDLQVAVQPDAAAEFASMASTVQVGARTVLSPLARVAGGSGSFELVDVTVPSGSERVKATARLTDGRVEVDALSAGEALISLGIRDVVTGNEFSGIIRVTATPGAAPLTVPPLRAFVRPLADSTVEVLDVIPGASSRPLSVQAVKVVDGELRADIIEHSRVRVAGSTADGAPGRIGAVDVTVSEGPVGAQGRLTVFQVPEVGAKGAIAVADSASVRAGSVVDIRVLDNDGAAPGERLILHPEVTGSGAKGELAFASGSVLRYLAPKQPGTYRVNYTTYGASNPEAGDVGTVTINVLPRGANQDPTPATVTVRVAPGEQGQVEVPLSGVDPDGDRVRLVAVDQAENPKLATSLSFSGTALTAAASAQAELGSTTVNYTVRDGEGGTGTGKLRVIVTPAADDAGAPIASSDYLRLVRGSDDPVSLRLLDNDIDPAHGNLKILSVEPNLPGGQANPNFKQMQERLDLAAIKQGVVSVVPGDELGTVSYRYTVQSSASKSTSDGLLLVQTSERVGAQAPVVADTVLNVRERSDISDGGVDVVTDKARWAAGDPSTLKLALWGGNRGEYRVDGSRIVGPYNPDGDLVAFELSGVDASGTEVSTYGFLIVPPLDELRITLIPGVEPIRVDENKTVDASLRSFLDVSANDRVELAQKDFPVGRAQASCSAISPSDIRYSAGAEEPWSDTCLVSARLVGQKNWTTLPVPVSIVPRAPIVQLNALTRTIAPGGVETIDLADMVDWQGNRAGEIGKLRFSVSGGGSLFSVQQSGTRLTAEARADAAPGNQEGLTVTVTGEGDSLAPLTLRVGEAPKDTPRGGTVKLTCTVGSSCGTEVIGVAGEYDPFAGKTGGGLVLESVSASTCTIGAVSRSSERGVSVSWPDSRGPGGSCTVGFTVRDAQGRTGEGSIELDAQGVPRAPASLSPQSFTGNSVTFVVQLGAAQSAHPSVTGVEVSGAGRSECSPAGPASYRCTVTGLENGVKHSFTARAVNSVGSSDPSSAVEAWAYQSPAPPAITELKSVQDDRVTQTQGVIEFSLQGERDVKGYIVTVAGQQHEYPGRNVNEKLVVPVGGQQFSVVSLSAHQPPEGAQNVGLSAMQNVTVAGSPRAESLIIDSPDSRTLTAEFSVPSSNFSDLPFKYSYSIKRNGTAAECPRDYASYGETAVGTFTDLKSYRFHNVRACLHNGYGSFELSGNGYPGITGGGEVPGPGGQTEYSVATTATIVGSRGDYGIITDASPQPSSAEMTLQFRVDGVISDTFSHSESSASPIEVRQCADPSDENSCSPFRALGWTGAPTIVRAQLTGKCVPEGNALDVLDISLAARPFATAVGDAAGTVTITWSGSFSGLNPLVLQGTPCPPPEPDPESVPPAP